MPDVAVSASTLSPFIEVWLAPLDEASPCGPNLEYEPEFLELLQATGKAANQFGPGEPADWPRIQELAQSLLSRTRDLRLAMWWGRAGVNLLGFAALPSALALMYGLLDRFWDALHPLPDVDDADSLARLSVIGGLDKLDSLLGDVRNAKLLSDPRFATLKARDVEIAMGKLAARADESARTQGQVTGMLSEVPDAAAALGAQARAVVASLREIQSLMSDRFRADLVVDLATMRGIASSVVAVVPEIAQTEVASEATSDQKVEVTAEPASRRGGVFSVDTRADALRAIELVCAYLERNEPTNPAQFLLHRAARVIDKNFLQLVKELAPDSMKDVAKIMGIDPATVTDLN